MKTAMFTLHREDGKTLEITRAQWEALKEKFLQSQDITDSLDRFVNRVQSTVAMDQAIVVPWCGMWLVIERDGYTHT